MSCRLLANQLVARQLVNTVGASALLKRHPDPVEHRLEELAISLRNTLNVDLAFESSSSLSVSLQRIHQQCSPLVAQVVEMHHVLGFSHLVF